MLKVHKKTEEEINKERNEDRYYQRLVKGTTKPVCPYYLLTKDGKKIDVSTLSEQQILTLCSQALRKGYADKLNRNYDKNGHLEIIDETAKLIQVWKDEVGYEPSYDGIKQIIKLLEDKNPDISFCSRDLLAPLVEKKVPEVYMICKFLQESKGNYNEPTVTELLQVVDQLSQNDINQKKQLSKNKQV